MKVRQTLPRCSTYIRSRRRKKKKRLLCFGTATERGNSLCSLASFSSSSLSPPLPPSQVMAWEGKEWLSRLLLPPQSVFTCAAKWTSPSSSIFLGKGANHTHHKKLTFPSPTLAIVWTTKSFLPPSPIFIFSLHSAASSSPSFSPVQFSHLSLFLSENPPVCLLASEEEEEDSSCVSAAVERKKKIAARYTVLKRST